MNYKDWRIVKSPLGKVGKIKASDLSMLPRGWYIPLEGNCIYYKKGGELTERAQGARTIKSRKDIKDLSNRLYYDYGLLMGKLNSL